jgi:hypothetical protein
LPETPRIKLCDWTNFPTQPALTLAVYTVPGQDTAGFLRFPDAAQTSVAGFGAVDMPSGYDDGAHSCIVRVDVAPKQGLWVSYSVDYGDLPGQSHELMCQKAHASAEAIIQTLSARAN